MAPARRQVDGVSAMSVDDGQEFLRRMKRTPLIASGGSDFRKSVQTLQRSDNEYASQAVPGGMILTMRAETRGRIPLGAALGVFWTRGGVSGL